MEQAITVIWHSHGRKAKCKPNPDYPNGKFMDVSTGDKTCEIELPYPASECGLWIVKCVACDQSIGVTAAGRPDDPIGIKFDCKNRGENA